MVDRVEAMTEAILLSIAGILILLGLFLIAAGIAGMRRTRAAAEWDPDVDEITARYRRAMVEDERRRSWHDGPDDPDVRRIR
jgi:membrane protein insertase Oxa1/YidC/SpoIIIJ